MQNYEIFLTLYWGSIYVTGGIQLLFVAGVMWAPFGGLLAAWRARNGGFDDEGSGSYALHGAMYSMLLMVPWFLLMANLFRRPGSDRVTRLLYILLYASLIAGPMGYSWLMMLDTGGPIGTIQKAYLSCIGLLMAVGVVATLKNFIVWDISHRWRPDGLLGGKHLLPFVLLLVSTLLALPFAGYLLAEGLMGVRYY